MEVKQSEMTSRNPSSVLCQFSHECFEHPNKFGSKLCAPVDTNEKKLKDTVCERRS